MHFIRSVFKIFCASLSILFVFCPAIAFAVKSDSVTPHFSSHLNEIYTYSVLIILPLTLANCVVSRFFHECKTKDLALSLCSLLICVFAMDCFGELLVKSNKLPEIANIVLIFAIPIFLYWLIYKVSGFAHPIKRTLLILVFTALFVVIANFFYVFIEVFVPLNWATVLILLLLSLYPAVLIFTRDPDPNDYNEDEWDINMSAVETIPQQQDLDMFAGEPLQYRQVPFSQDTSRSGYMEHPEYPKD